jgi:hypothetical protein
VISFTHRPLYPRERAPGTHWRKLVGCLISAEREQLFTAMLCFSTREHFVQLILHVEMELRCALPHTTYIKCFRLMFYVQSTGEHLLAE